MPTYSYRCQACGRAFDVVQKMTDEPLKVCEECGGQLKKIISSVGIVFKGSGFYHNDAHSKKADLTAHSDSHLSADSGSSHGGSSDSSAENSPSIDSSSSSAPTTGMVNAPGRTK